ncbi:MAG: GNAT family N-acetyltransferase [Proteobacteria bacterium]|nr:GNAT family N-acetyltransferase [Pseudomonadota bacterium]
MPENIVLRPASRKDIATMRKLMEKEKDLFPDNDPWSVGYTEGIVANGIVLVAEMDGRVAGFIAGEKLLGGGTMIWLRIIEPSLRGLGLGTMLSDYFEQILRDQNTKWMISYAKPKVANFHKKRGAFIGGEYLEIFKEF